MTYARTDRQESRVSSQGVSATTLDLLALRGRLATSSTVKRSKVFGYHVAILVVPSLTEGMELFLF